jgi:hypothetical protein
VVVMNDGGSQVRDMIYRYILLPLALGSLSFVESVLTVAPARSRRRLTFRKEICLSSRACPRASEYISTGTKRTHLHSAY